MRIQKFRTNHAGYFERGAGRFPLHSGWNVYLPKIQKLNLQTKKKTALPNFKLLNTPDTR